MRTTLISKTPAEKAAIRTATFAGLRASAENYRRRFSGTPDPQRPWSRHALVNATTSVRFTRAGVYKFATKAGEDYMKGVKTVGEDNVLRLTVTVR
jgi:hypothetical protein